MARFFKHLLALASYLLLLTSSISCQEGGEAGDFFGQWRMKGTEGKYISFSGSTTWLKSMGEGDVFGNFQHVGDSLFIQCYSINATPGDTAIVEQAFGWKPINDIRLKINVLDGDNLVVSKGGQTWSFYKY
jgi:hypothetical protein